MNTKVCKGKNGCGIKKLLKKFAYDKYTKDGYSYICRVCDSKRTKKYRENNKEKERHRCKKYRENNIERELQRCREYRKNNREEINRKAREYRENNKEKELQRNKKYRENNKEKELQRCKKYKKNNPDKVRHNKRKRRARIKAVNENYSTRDEQITYEIFNNRCFNCNTSDNLSIDHHNCLNDGNPLSVNNAVILCISCNSSKGIKAPEKFYTISQLKKLLNYLD